MTSSCIITPSEGVWGILLQVLIVHEHAAAHHAEGVWFCARSRASRAHLVGQVSSLASLQQVQGTLRMGGTHHSVRMRGGRWGEIGAEESGSLHCRPPAGTEHLTRRVPGGGEQDTEEGGREENMDGSCLSDCMEEVGWRLASTLKHPNFTCHAPPLATPVTMAVYSGSSKETLTWL